MDKKTRVCVYEFCRRPALLYPGGARCDQHTPAREAGKPEAPTPGRPWWVRPDGTRLPLPSLSTSRVHDERAVASGRRVSGALRRAADAAEAYEAIHYGERGRTAS